MISVVNSENIVKQYKIIVYFFNNSETTAPCDSKIDSDPSLDKPSRSLYGSKDINNHTIKSFLHKNTFYLIYMKLTLVILLLVNIYQQLYIDKNRK